MTKKSYRLRMSDFNPIPLLGVLRFQKRNQPYPYEEIDDLEDTQYIAERNNLILSYYNSVITLAWGLGFGTLLDKLDLI